jgi:tungstate transport system substrate-binding protein
MVSLPLVLVSLMVLTGCLDRQSNGDTLRIATTTSLDDSGLLDEILPDFEEAYDVSTDVIAVGTGQALTHGENGDVDLVLVHAPDLEQEFIDGGYGINRTTVMENSFIVVGPVDDPADVAGASDAGDAFVRIAESESQFVSRGDDSGTHVAEQGIWESVGLLEEVEGQDWYHAVGQGMGETLLTSNELEAYVLTDRATFVTIEDQQVADLDALFGDPDGPGAGDPQLENPYSAIAVNPETHQEVEIDLAEDFLEWFNSDETRESIANFGIEEYGTPLFTLIEE